MKLVSVVIFVVATSVFFTIARAQGDLTPPVLIDLQIEPARVDTGDAAQAITVTARITDDLSGTIQAWLIFRPLISSTQWTDVVFRDADRLSGDALDGVYRGTLTLPQYAAEGRWVLVEAQFADAVGNYAFLMSGADDWPASFDAYHFANAFDTTPTPTVTPTPTLTPTPTWTPWPTSTPRPTQTPMSRPTSMPMPHQFLPLIR